MIQGSNLKKSFLYFFFIFIAGLTSLNTFAQERGHGAFNRPNRAAPSGTSREPRIQSAPPRSQNPGSIDRPHNTWNRQPRQIQSNNAPRPRINPQANNNHFNRSPGNNRPNPGNYNNNASRYGRPGWAYRRPEYNAYNPGWRYHYFPRRNSIVTSFSFGYQTINYGGFGYRYYDGVFYQPYNSAFRVIAPPFGIFINVLPFGYRRIVVNDYPYYYYNGTYYDDYQSSYRVVQPPVGAVVESIPEGYETIVIDGETYYKVDNVQYKPVVQDNGEIWYEVIKVS